ncbi:MFS transporter [Paramicrobacterium chengjingii]|uniref:MFS transporter n=1 Tax=Paramicrobacterium chengjingii TaxID=2769067 RepID=A0ABX6YMP8_9MICO|nr:MFS transporter [Microbacterium chengjingii]QPZ40134.1 MFS transporter [Microbacterium chengjingii]
MFRSLSSFNYRIWFIGALVSNIGAWMQATTQDWVVLVDLTDNDALAVGTTMALQFGPQLLLVPISGYIADHFDRRKILMCTQSALALLAAGLGILLLTGVAELWHVFIFAFTLGVVNAIDTPARQVFVSDLVGQDNMANAVSLNSASFNTARLIGPAVAGILIALVGSGWVFMINAVSFIAVLTVLVSLRVKELYPSPRATGSPIKNIVEGFLYVKARPDLTVIFVIVFIMGAFGMNFPIVASTMAVEFGRGASEYGALSSILAIGSLTGALLAARRARPQMRIVITAAGLFGAASTVSGVMPTYISFAISLILVGFSTVTLLTTANSYVQTTTAPIIRGRVMALYGAILMGSTPVGAPIVGWVANAFGARWTLGVGALAGFAACAVGLGWLIVSRELRLHRDPSSRWRLVVTHFGKPMPGAATTNLGRMGLTTPIQVVHGDDGRAEYLDVHGKPFAADTNDTTPDAVGERADTKEIPTPPAEETFLETASIALPASAPQAVPLIEPETLTGQIRVKYLDDEDDGRAESRH